MTREQYNKAKVLCASIDKAEIDINIMKSIQQDCSAITARDKRLNYITIPASTERIQDFLEIVMQDLVTRKAKLEKELSEI